jgi:hypothetical protein
MRTIYSRKTLSATVLLFNLAAISGKPSITRGRNLTPTTRSSMTLPCIRQPSFSTLAKIGIMLTANGRVIVNRRVFERGRMTSWNSIRNIGKVNILINLLRIPQRRIHPLLLLLAVNEIDLPNLPPSNSGLRRLNTIAPLRCATNI